MFLLYMMVSVLDFYDQEEVVWMLVRRAIVNRAIVNRGTAADNLYDPGWLHCKKRSVRRRKVICLFLERSIRFH
jgi:hypothetical protein